MTVNVVSTTVIKCNRCAHEDTWIPETPEFLKWEWSKLTQGEDSGGKFFISRNKKISFDLCPSCTREIKDWIRNGR